MNIRAWSKKNMVSSSPPLDGSGFSREILKLGQMTKLILIPVMASVSGKKFEGLMRDLVFTGW